MAELLITASQTVGPFFKHGLEWKGGDRLFPDSAPGRRIELGGIVTDAKNQPVTDAVIEFWQADASGRLGTERTGAAGGFGRVPTDESGRFTIHTIYPGRVAGADGKPQAPHILAVLFARGLQLQVVTRVYFEDDPANAGDTVLGLCGKRSGTLVARRDAARDGVYHWNISLQGPEETVFFEA